MSQEKQEWEIVAMVTNDRTKIFRVRHDFPEGLDRKAYSECVIIEWTYGGDLPSPDMAKQLARFEDHLWALDDLEQGSVQVLVITGNGKREWCYYAKNYDYFMAGLNAALVSQPKFPIKIVHDVDADWAYWAKLRELVRTEEQAAKDGPALLDMASAAEQSIQDSAKDVRAAQIAAYEPVAKKIAANSFKLLTIPPCEYQICNANDFSHLDLSFYQRAAQEFTKLGFDKCIDAEPLHLAQTFGKRVFIRYMLSTKEAATGLIFSITPVLQLGFFARLSAKLFGKKTQLKPGTIELITEFSNGEVVQTNTSLGKNPFSSPQEIHLLQMPPDSSVSEVLEKHRQRVTDFRNKSPGLTELRAASIEEVTQRVLREQQLKHQHRLSIGGITREELRGLAKEKFPYVEENVMKEMRRLISGLNKEGASNMPEWATLFSPTDYAYFIEVVQADLMERGLNGEITDGMYRIVDSEAVYGLQNIAKICQQSGDRSLWPKLVAEHFSTLMQGFAQAANFGSDSQDFGKIAPHLSARLYPADFINGSETDPPVARFDLEATVTVLVIDLPDAVMTVTRSMSAAWGKSDTELFDIAMQWLTRDESIEQGEVELAPGVTTKMLASDGFYAASRALILEQHEGFVGTHGALIGIPHRHALVAYPIESSAVVNAIKTLWPAMKGMFAQGPGAISSELYWYFEGRYMRLPFRGEGKKFVFDPPQEFSELLKTLQKGMI